MTCATFGPSLLPELREILLSTGQGISYGPDGEPAEVTDEPFPEQCRLGNLEYDPNRGRSRIVCVLTAPDGRDVTATIDASDFREPRRDSTGGKQRNASDHRPSLASYLSMLLEEQIITRDPATVPDHVRIQSPADRPRVGDSGDHEPRSSWWAMRGE